MYFKINTRLSSKSLIYLWSKTIPNQKKPTKFQTTNSSLLSSVRILHWHIFLIKFSVFPQKNPTQLRTGWREAHLTTFNILHLILNANIMLVFYYADLHTSLGGCYWRKGLYSCPQKASEGGPLGPLPKQWRRGLLNHFCCSSRCGDSFLQEGINSFIR